MKIIILKDNKVFESIECSSIEITPSESPKIEYETDGGRAVFGGLKLPFYVVDETTLVEGQELTESEITNLEANDKKTDYYTKDEVGQLKEIVDQLLIDSLEV